MKKIQKIGSYISIIFALSITNTTVATYTIQIQSYSFSLDIDVYNQQVMMDKIIEKKIQETFINKEFLPDNLELPSNIINEIVSWTYGSSSNNYLLYLKDKSMHIDKIAFIVLLIIVNFFMFFKNPLEEKNKFSLIYFMQTLGANISCLFFYEVIHYIYFQVLCLKNYFYPSNKRGMDSFKVDYFYLSNTDIFTKQAEIDTKKIEKMFFIITKKEIKWFNNHTIKVGLQCFYHQPELYPCNVIKRKDPVCYASCLVSWNARLLTQEEQQSIFTDFFTQCYTESFISSIFFDILQKKKYTFGNLLNFRITQTKELLEEPMRIFMIFSFTWIATFRILEKLILPGNLHDEKETIQMCLFLWFGLVPYITITHILGIFQNIGDFLYLSHAGIL